MENYGEIYGENGVCRRIDFSTNVDLMRQNGVYGVYGVILDFGDYKFA
jgi:hypothetical protein